jgi:DNA-binding MarR family transcriptional regulator
VPPTPTPRSGGQPPSGDPPGTDPASTGHPGGEPLPELASRLGYLLKHAQLRLAELTGAAMAPFGVTGRECGVLIAIDSRAPLSQQEVAHRLAVDRTSMVALIDDLEGKGLVQRRRDPDDRRKNVVTLTEAGRTTLRQASRAGDEAERRFLSALPGDQAALLKEALRAVAFPPPASAALDEPAAVLTQLGDGGDPQ